MALLQHVFSIPSMRLTIKEIETNMACHWFLGLGVDEKVPHFSMFGKNYVRRLQGTGVFESILSRPHPRGRSWILGPFGPVYRLPPHQGERKQTEVQEEARSTHCPTVQKKSTRIEACMKKALHPQDEEC